jgi:hypothetical protein
LPLIRIDYIYDKDLILKGLKLIYDLNQWNLILITKDLF